MWKLSKGLAKAFKNSSSLARYSEGAGAVPTHVHGDRAVGTSVETGELLDPDETAIHEDASKNVGGRDYASSLADARRRDAENVLRGLRDGTLTDPNALQMASRAKEIMASKGWDKSRFGDALQIARKEKFDRHLAAADAADSVALRFNECGGLKVDPRSVLVARRANEIMRENNLGNSNFGEALRQSRAEYAQCDRVMEFAEELLRLAER